MGHGSSGARTRRGVAWVHCNGAGANLCAIYGLGFVVDPLRFDFTVVKLKLRGIRSRTTDNTSQWSKQPIQSVFLSGCLRNFFSQVIVEWDIIKCLRIKWHGRALFRRRISNSGRPALLYSVAIQTAGLCCVRRRVFGFIHRRGLPQARVEAIRLDNVAISPCSVGHHLT